MPEIIKIDFNSIERYRDSLTRIKQHLGRGGVIAYPTDTYYGLGANPFFSRAVTSIFQIKRRPRHKPILVLIADEKQVRELTDEISPASVKLIRNLWPGPLTLLFKALPHLPGHLTAGTGKVGLRLPAHDFSRRLIEFADHPLTAPSANPSGGKNCCTAQEVAKMLDSSFMIVDGGPTAGGRESTVLDTTVTPPKLIRPGAVSKEQIEDVLDMHLSTAS